MLQIAIYRWAATICRLVPRVAIIRLKKINPMSQSCRAHLFFGARLIQQNSRFEFFLLAWFFFSFFYDLLVKKYKKRYDRHNETLWTTNFFNSCVLPCILFIQNQVPCFKAVTDSNLTRLLLRKKKKTVKKTAFRSGLPICHELWDIAFIFCSLKVQVTYHVCQSFCLHVNLDYLFVPH